MIGKPRMEFLPFPAGKITKKISRTVTRNRLLMKLVLNQ